MYPQEALNIGETPLRHTWHMVDLNSFFFSDQLNPESLNSYGCFISLTFAFNYYL